MRGVMYSSMTRRRIKDTATRRSWIAIHFVRWGWSWSIWVMMIGIGLMKMMPCWMTMI